MKKQAFITAILAAVPFICTAQSSVTLYGIADTGLAYVSNQTGGAVWKAQSGNLAGDRLGLRGAEDLGGGLQGIFLLENGFEMDSGRTLQGGRLFGRQAYVGLKSNEYGALTLGRQYESVLQFVGTTFGSASNWATIVGAHIANADNLTPAFRVNNSIKYTSIDYHGFQFGGLYGLSDQSSGVAMNKAWSLGARYSSGPLSLAVGYFRLDHPNESTAGAVGASGSGASSDYVGAAALAIFGGSGNINRHQVLAVGGSYTIDHTTLGLLYSQIALDATINSAKAENYEISNKYKWSPDLQLAAAYIYTGARSDAGERRKYQQINLGADYFLSKRTDIYIVGLYQKALGDAKVANLYLQPASGGSSQASIIAGIRHAF
jgi:GBP family porin